MPHRLFIHWDKYQTAKQDLADKLDALEQTDPAKPEAFNQALQAYDEFHRLTEHNYPLLLRVGEPVSLQQKPSAIYLLPNVAGMDARILVVQIPKTPGNPACLQLYAWQPSEPEPTDPSGDLRTSAQVLPWGDKPNLNQPFSIKIKSEGCDLGERPLKINPISLNPAMLVFELEFINGKLMVATSSEGNQKATVNWSPTGLELANRVQVERASVNSMPEIIRYRRRGKEYANWQDDELLTKDGETIYPGFRNTNQRFIGRINGADGDVDKGICFLATDDGRILHLNLSNGEIQAAKINYRYGSSQILDGPLKGVVMLPKEGDKLRALAPCHNGVLYLIEVGADGVDIVKTQNAERLQIQRMVADVNGEILAMDQNHRLCPLRLNDYADHDGLKKKALCQLAEFPVPTADDSRLIYWRVLVQFWLGNPGQTGLQRHLFEAMDAFKQQLAQADINHAQRQQAAEHYYAMLKLLYQWVGDPLNTADLQPVIQKLPDWLTLPDTAPDWLWLKLFRQFDMMEYATHPLPTSVRNTDPDQFKPLRQLVYRQRCQIAQQAQQIRPLSVVASTRLPGQAKHIRRLGWGRQGPRFACTAYAYGLYAYELVQQTEDVYFELLAQCSGNSHHQSYGPQWQGRIRTVTTEINGHDGWVLIATHRGECHLLRLTQHGSEWSFERIASVDIKLRCATSCFVTYRISPVSTRKGFLIAGSNPEGKASIFWLNLKNDQLDQSREIYCSERSGHIRMLTYDSDYPNDLWGVDEQRGLFYWSLEPLVDPANNRLNETLIHRPGESLHALYRPRQRHSDKHPDKKAPAQIIYGGLDGMTLGLSAEPAQRGQLLWSTGCGPPVKQIRPVETHTGSVLVLAGDAANILLYDTAGRLTGMLEAVGPVSGMATLYDQEGQDSILLLGAKSGRLMAVSTQQLRVPGNEVDLPNDDPLGYALRRPPTTWNQEQTYALLRSGESLLFQQGLAALWHCFEQITSSDQADFIQKAESAIRLRHRDAPKTNIRTHRAALAIRWPHSLTNGTSRWLEQNRQALCIAWLQAHWNKLSERNEDEILCLVVNSILFVAEPLINTAPDAKQLAWQVSDCIWPDTPPADDTCPANFYLTSRLRMMRLAQATRIWRHQQNQELAAYNSQSAPSGTRLFRRNATDRKKTNQAIVGWVNSLAFIWDGVPTDWQARLDWLMRRQYPLVAQLDENKWNWLDWLREPKNPEIIQALDLNKLQAWSGQAAWTEQEQAQLAGLFRDPDWPNQSHTVWSAWINRLAERMQAVLEARQSIPHFAWLEENYLNRLKDHIEAVADQQLTSQHGLALAALVWHIFRPRWLEQISQRIDELHDLELEDDEHSMDIKPEYHWRNQRLVQAVLNIRFRGTRGVSIDHATDLDGNPIVGAQRGANIAADDHYHAYSIGLKTDQADVLDKQIELVCQDFRGIPFNRAVHLQDQRGLLGFRDTSDWQQQAIELTGLLDKAKPFQWLRGPDWPPQEHDRLIALVQDRYPVAYQAIEFIQRLDQALNQDAPLFVSGFASESGSEATALHDVLHQHHPGGLNPLALSAWLWAKPASQSKPLWEALAGQIPNEKSISDLLQRLDKKGLKPLKKAIQAYPPSQIIRWSCGGVVEEPDAMPWLGELGMPAWQALLQAGLADTRLARGFGVPKASIGHLRQQMSYIENIANRSNNLVQALADATLPGIQLDDMYGIPVLIHPLDLMHHTWDCVYIVPKGAQIPRNKLSAGLWLLLEHHTLQQLSGETLTLSRDQLLGLLTAGGSEHDPSAAQNYLNRIAVTQLTLNPDAVFQIAGGLREDLISRSFHGRKSERETLLNTTRIGGAVLVAGARRVGKTTLLDRLSYDLARQPKPPVWVSINGLSLPSYTDTEKDAPFLRWFLRQISDQFEEQGQFIRYQWQDSANAAQREQAISIFSRRLAEIGQAAGIPVLLLDETADLLRVDIQSAYSVGKLLRDWLDANLISIIVTAYPYGSDEHPSLYHHANLNRTGNPWYNLFDRGILQLKPWSPHETWDFLAPRLTGFGLMLPRQFAPSLLELTRGIPWITQSVGLALCKRPKGRSNQITRGDWEQAISETYQTVRNQLRDTVRSVANELDSQLVDEQTPIRFGQGRLWLALLAEADRGRPKPVSIGASTWPEPHELNLPRLQRSLGDSVSKSDLQHALVALSGVGLLEGREGDTRFFFWNDLLPAFVKE